MFASLHKSTLTSILVAGSLFSAKALGCSCAAPPPPCQAIGQSQLVFLGTVTETGAQPGSFKTVRMNVDRAFKGDLKKTIELFDDGMCDGPDLQIGKQYLMYTSGFPNSVVPARGCTRSRRIEDADQDLDFLKQYAVGNVTTHINGIVRFRPDEPEDTKLGNRGRTALKDVWVTLSGDSKQFHSTTTSIGSYSFSKLPPGEYTVDADLSGYRLAWAPESIMLAANGCVEANLLMEIDRRVQGFVRDDDGAPVSGVLVQMVSTNQHLKRWEQPVLLGISDGNGNYTVDGIPPGDYYLGVNVGSTPTKKSPYASAYYPNTPDLRQAMPISITTGASVQNFDLRVPRKLSLVTIRGRIQTADGKPPLLQDHPQVRIKEPGLYGQIEQETIEVNAEGQFQFDLCEGIRYSAFAFSGPTRLLRYSGPVEFTPSKENDQLVLTLDKTPEEFRKLRPK
jgi:hypothetical protein